MSVVRQLAPIERDVDAAEIARQVAVGPRLSPFSADALAFCAELSDALLRTAEGRRHPEIQALAFWMRPNALRRMRAEFDAVTPRGTIAVAHGVAFHIAPSNVDTMFVYSWVLSLLAGNCNIIRLPERRSRVSAALVEAITRALARPEHGSIGLGTAIVGYAHDAGITRTLSAEADLRIVWGGDATVAQLRTIPLPPHARELTFPDRSSLCAIAAGAYLQLDDEGRDRLAERFYADAYAFDQMACSSPDLVVWCGADADAAAASRCLFHRVRRVAAARGHSIDAATALRKLTYASRAVLDAQVVGCTRDGAVTVLTLAEGAPRPAERCGGGLFHEVRVDDVSGIAGLATRRDQTMTYFGFGGEALRDLVAALNGRGIDRVVPIGRALMFNRFWDGKDLLQEMTRRVYVEAEEAPAPAASLTA